MSPAVLHTARLRLLPPDPRLAGALAAYFARNAAHLAPWEPRREGALDPAVQAASLQQMDLAHRQGLAWRWLLQPKDDTAGAGSPPLIGSVALSGVVRGFHHSANLGYALDAQFEGQGLMREAVEAVLAEAFGPALNLHRVQAASLPHNARSIGLLQRLGFREIGLARDYLCIDGRWQDHRLFERLNPDFRAAAAGL